MKRILIFTTLIFLCLSACGTDIKKELSEDDEEVLLVEEEFETEHEMVHQPAILIDEDKISLYFFVDDSVTTEERKELGKEFAKKLSAKISDIYGLKEPGESYYGELFEHYTLFIAIKGENEKRYTSWVKAKNSDSIGNSE